MAFKIEAGKLKSIQPVEPVRKGLSSWQVFKRAFVSHTCVAVFALTISMGLSLENANLMIKESTDTFQQLATYSGCAARDQLGNFFWKPFPDNQQVVETGIKTRSKKSTK